jgi:RNA polymerase sigma-70 factor (ECF subfamily)
MESEDLDAALEGLHPLGFAWALRCCQGNRAEAEDVLHQSYLKVLDGRARFEGRSTFKTWLFGVIRRTAAEQDRWHWVQAARLGRWWRERSPADPDPATTIDAGDEATRLQVALQRLSKRQAQVLHLVFYQDLTILEAAEVLSLPVGTARTHYQRGKDRLRAILARSGESR